MDSTPFEPEVHRSYEARDTPSWGCYTCLHEEPMLAEYRSVGRDRGSRQGQQSLAMLRRQHVVARGLFTRRYCNLELQLGPDICLPMQTA
jgi:hypothetical protein